MTAADIEVAKGRMTTYYDMELRGVRRLMGVFLKDFCDIVLMRDEGGKGRARCMLPGMDLLGSAINNTQEWG